MLPAGVVVFIALNFPTQPETHLQYHVPSHVAIFDFGLAMSRGRSRVNDSRYGRCQVSVRFGEVRGLYQDITWNFEEKWGALRHKEKSYTILVSVIFVDQACRATLLLR